MPYVAPVVGFFVHRPRFRLYCASCATAFELAVADADPVFADSDPHNVDPCDACGKPLVDLANPPAKVKVAQR